MPHTHTHCSLIHIGGGRHFWGLPGISRFPHFVLARKLVRTGDSRHSGVQTATQVTAERVDVGPRFFSQDEQGQPNGGGLPHFHFGDIFEDLVSSLVPLWYRLDPASYFGGVARGFGTSNGFRHASFAVEHHHFVVVRMHHTSESVAVFL